MFKNENRELYKILGVFIVIIICVFSYTVISSGKNGSFKMIVGDNEIVMNLEKDNTLSVNSMLFQLLQADKKRESEAMLREFGGFYKVSDPYLVDAIEKQDDNSDVSVKLRSLLENMKGPFQRKSHTFYNLESVDILDAIKELGFDHNVSKGLRELLAYRQGPFKDNASKIFISAPDGNHITESNGKSCSTNRFFRHKTRIFNESKTNSIDIFVNDNFPCIRDSDLFEETNKVIRISNNDMKKLLGDSHFSTKENAFAVMAVTD